MSVMDPGPPLDLAQAPFLAARAAAALSDDYAMITSRPLVICRDRTRFAKAGYRAANLTSHGRLARRLVRKRRT